MMCVYVCVRLQMVVHFCRQKDSSTFVEVTAIAMISSSFLIGDTFPTAQGHFIPFHTPRELPITMKEILSIKDDRGPWSTHSQCRYRGEEERPWISKGNFLETLSRCCWLLGEIVDLLVPGFHLGSMCTLLWELEEGTINSSRSCG